MKINNCIQLWEEIGGWKVEMEERAKQLMEKSVFKGTACGCVFDADEKGVLVCGYAEGSDAELPTHYLKWGFTMDEYNAALAQADAEGTDEWHLAYNDMEFNDEQWPDEHDIGGEG